MIVKVARMYVCINVCITLYKLFKGTIKNIIPVILQFQLKPIQLSINQNNSPTVSDYSNSYSLV